METINASGISDAYRWHIVVSSLAGVGLEQPQPTALAMAF
jgi:hypothetical protein